MKKGTTSFLISLLLVALLGALVYFTLATHGSRGAASVTPPAMPEPPRPISAQPSSPAPAVVVGNQQVGSATATKPNASVVVPPVEGALARVTKKPFGIYVSPGNSPVSPERFQGYHTGVDFETTAAEQDIDVTVSAICAGPLLLKEWASGYGGVAVQSCRLGTQEVTVIYGHLRLSSISVAVRQELKPGQPLGVLGRGYSTETDGERKHLHLGIHQGLAIDIRGYVQNQADLGQWLDVRNYLGQ